MNMDSNYWAFVGLIQKEWKIAGTINFFETIF